MAKVSVKVVVAGRTYPISVEETEREKVIDAAADINKAIKMLKDNYAVKDMQDLLAMTALQLASKGNDKEPASVNTDLLEKIEADLESLADEFKA